MFRYVSKALYCEAWIWKPLRARGYACYVYSSHRSSKHIAIRRGAGRSAAYDLLCGEGEFHTGGLIAAGARGSGFDIVSAASCFGCLKQEAILTGRFFSVGKTAAEMNSRSAMDQ